MVRKSAMILAGFLTAVVLVLAAMAFNVTTNWPVALGAQSPESIDEPESAASVYVTGIASQADEIYRQREAMLLTQRTLSAEQRNRTGQHLSS